MSAVGLGSAIPTSAHARPPRWKETVSTLNGGVSKMVYLKSVRSWLWSVGSVAAFLASIHGCIADPGHRRPGLWAMSVQVVNSRSTPLLSRFCIDQETEQALTTLSTDDQGRDCPVLSVHLTRMGSVVDAVCREGTAIETSHTVIEVNEFSFHSRSERRTSVAVGRGRNQIVVASARWVGPCPRGMKPGDIVTANGLRFNLSALRLPKAAHP